MKVRILKTAGFATLLVLAVLYGMVAHKLQLPPYGLAKAAYDHIGVFTPKESLEIPKESLETPKESVEIPKESLETPKESVEIPKESLETPKESLETPKEPLETPKEPLETPKEYLETPKEYFETNVAELISISQQQDVSRLRTKLIELLWGNSELPPSLPSAVDYDIADTRYDDIPSLFRIHKASIVMEFGLESCVYHFIPKNPNNKVVLYHQGHDGDFYNSKAHIRRCLDEGYSVAAFAMPLLGLNNQPTIQIPRLGKLKLVNHDHMKFLSPERGHPVKYFLEPVVLVLNYLRNYFDYSSVSMVGISGGGWTTTIAAAIDSRIDKSFPVAGAYPIYLRSNSPNDWGDYEQTVPEIYSAVNYLELYILGSYGPNRKQLQIINQYDSCCFAGTKWETYKDIVRERVNELGKGEFDLFMDTSNKEHTISEVAMSRILNEIGSRSR